MAQKTEVTPEMKALYAQMIGLVNGRDPQVVTDVLCVVLAEVLFSGTSDDFSVVADEIARAVLGNIRLFQNPESGGVYH